MNNVSHLNDGEGIGVWGIGTISPIGHKILNNIVSQAAGWEVVNARQPRTILFRSNCCCKSPAQSVSFVWGPSGTSYSNPAAWRAATGQDSGSISINPLFAGDTGYDPIAYELLPGSPCAVAGLPITQVPVDFRGTLRSLIAPSIGAYEAGNAAVAIGESMSGFVANANNGIYRDGAG